ncbi:restriction endonuclease subunit S [Escherichia coli]|uniref:restriction endonuclease subunit S n=4 Tax=Escherichia coli TaxID=562 RepID=UPI000BE8B74E|nr:restriction endonuclease subunit S [Escherichia coli]EFB9788555.1 restriction endonuclease subunit S [Escherichia coli]EFK8490597.1 restriction endonuclease subunit S [Escherichia coli]EFM0521579.1 restriction endonuclease subunit S [Escherichia coli]EFM0569953.1 restriction endonuclease subunit S [Escherichia coli]MBN6331130.1 restriction endonuclease subunit S [Escherichia coli]
MSAGKLPEGWEQIEIGDIADVISGGTPKSGVAENFAPSGEGVAWLTPADLSGYKEKYISHGARDLTTLGYSSCSAKLMPKGTILFSSRAPIGYVAIAANEIATNQGFKSFAFPSDIFPDYAYYFLRNIRHIAEEMGTGTTFKEISGSSAKTLPFVLVSFAEQKIIAEKLDTLLARVDSTKARLEQIPQILKRFRQAVLSAAVSGNISGENDKFKRIHVDDFWSHDVVGLTHWREYKFSEIVDIIGGSQPPKSEFKYEMEEGYIRLIQIRDYKSDNHKVYIPLNKAKRFVEKHDVMIGRYGPPIFQILRGLEGAYNVALMKAVPKSELLDNEYLYWFLQNYKLYNFIEAGSDRTAGQSGVNKKHLESYPVLLPPIHEQAEIVRRVEQLFAYADTIEKQVNNALARVNNLTQSILAKAFRGELTAQWRAENPELISGENSAAALLEKIKAERAASGGKKASRKKS